MRYLIFAILTILQSFSVLAQKSDFSEVNFQDADSIAARYPYHSLKNLKLLSDKLTRGLSDDVEKFRAIYRWVCTNIASDYVLYQEHLHKRRRLMGRPEKLQQWEGQVRKRVFKNLLEERKSLCTGYAYLVRELAYHAGISCEIVNGYGRTPDFEKWGADFPNHSWNVVYLKDKWYLCDPTWSSGIYDLAKKQFVKSFNDTYFLTSPSWFAKNHYPENDEWLLLNQKLSLEDFLNQPLIHRSAIAVRLQLIAPLTHSISVNRNKEIIFRFRILNQSLAAKVQLLVRNKKLSPSLKRVDESTFEITHSIKRNGKYPVHLVYQDELLVSFLVEVS